MATSARRVGSSKDSRGRQPDAGENGDRRPFAYLQHALAEIHLREGDYAEAARREEAAWDALPPDKRDAAVAHSVLSSALALAQRDNALSEAERQAFERTYTERVAELAELSEELLDPPYLPTGRLTCLDVAQKANASLENTLPPAYGRVANHLAGLPRGKQSFSGVRFQIADAVILLQGGKWPWWPQKVEGIEVGRTFRKLYILQGAGTQDGNDGTPDGVVLGRYEVVYEDTSRETIHIVNGEDVRAWWHSESKPPRASEAHVGSA